MAKRGPSKGFLRFMRTVSALLLLVGLAGGLMLTFESGRAPEPEGFEFATQSGPGSLLLEPVDVVGPDPFTVPVAVDLDLDPATMALPPASPESLISPHQRGSTADRLAGGALGWEIVVRRGSGNPVPANVIQTLADEVLPPTASVSDLDDIDGDGLDDDGRFTITAGDGSAVCVTPGSARTLALAQGLAVDPEDGSAANGYAWSPYGPCGSQVELPTGSPLRVGSTPGVYGAVTGGEVCDVRAYAETLAANPRVASAVGAVHQLDDADVLAFVEGLTPVVLLRDTAVTNFGWRDGKIVPRQSVLERRTAVLIDRRGLPVIRCLSGTPLRSPNPVPTAPAVRGPEWPGFAVALVDEIGPGENNVSEFIFVDVLTANAVRRTPGISGGATVLAGPVVGSFTG